MNKTVIFSGLMQHVVLSPYWYVPQSIIQKEVVPGMNEIRTTSLLIIWNGTEAMYVKHLARIILW